MLLVCPFTNRYGAAGVWVGTRFVASVEAGAPKIHKDLIVSASYDDTARTIIYTGRPLQVRKTDYIVDWYVERLSQVPSGFSSFCFEFFDLLGKRTGKTKSKSSLPRARFPMRSN